MAPLHRAGPTLDEQIAFHDKWNALYRIAEFENLDDESQARGGAVLDLIANIPVNRPRILEVGCGTGWLTERMAEHGECTGVDLSPKAIEIASGRNVEAKFMCADFMEAQIPKGAFDIAIAVETIAYVNDQPAFLRKIASHVKPGGYFILTTVNTFVYNRRSNIGPPKPGQIRQWLTMRQLRLLLMEQFRILKATTVLPKGDRGILRILNSCKANRLANVLVSERRIARLKESFGLGHCRVILAQRHFV